MRKEDTSAQGKIVTEILQHLHACNNSVAVFYGRVGELELLRESDILFLKHACTILRQSSNPVCGFSMMEQVRFCAVWPREN